MPERVFRGLSVCNWCATCCVLLRLVAQHFTALDVTTTPRPAAFLNLLEDVGVDLYKSRFSMRLKTGRCRDNLRSKGELKTGILPLR